LWDATLTNKIHGSQLLLTQQMVFYHAAILTAVNQEVNGKKVARARAAISFANAPINF